VRDLMDDPAPNTAIIPRALAAAAAASSRSLARLIGLSSQLVGRSFSWRLHLLADL